MPPSTLRTIVTSLLRSEADHVQGLSPRQSQTLRRPLHGDSEKQIAQALRLSRHTVHVYVKKIYTRLGVSGRSEMFARFLRAVLEDG